MCEADIDRHDHAEVHSVPHYNYESRMGNSPGAHGLYPLTFHINVFLEFPTTHHEENIDWSCTALTDEEQGDVFADFQDAIHEHWNDKLWIGPRNRAHRAQYHSFACGISLHRVQQRSRAELIICMLATPTSPEGVRRNALPASQTANLPPPPRYTRSHCQIDGWSTAQTRNRTDMTLAWQTYFQPSSSSNGFDFESSQPTSDRGDVVFVQSRAAHELGHYLGLHHPGFPRTHEDRSAASYLTGSTFARQNVLMSTGNEMVADYGAPWVERLLEHHYHCGIAYEPHLDPSSYPAWRRRH
ncbi:MAG: hypothetical protein H6719_09890 [Sandaracinaceae bacterium]|nr:hypothetical protein [Sandaracinaceae bacterium]